MDGLLMGFLARELEAALVGGRVDRVSQPEDDLLILQVRAAGRTHRLLICAMPGYTRLHLTEKAYENPAEAPMFCMLLRKHLVGARLLSVSQLFGDRLLRLAFRTSDELGDEGEAALWFEAMGKHSNLTLVRDGRILDAMRHVTAEMSRVRQMLPGLPFVMPPRQDKLDMAEASREDVLGRLRSAAGPLKRFLAENVSGLNAASAAEIARRAAGDAQAPVDLMPAEETARHITNVFRELPGLASPRLLIGGGGQPEAALPFPYLSLPQESQRPTDTLSRALETLYFERDRTQRLDQKAAGLRKAIKPARERVLSRLERLDEDILTPEQAEELRMSGELLTAHMHMVPRGAAEVTLPSYYTGGDVTIRLDATLPPSQNAQRYFTRYRKAHTARKLAGEQREKAREELRLLDEAEYFAGRAEGPQELTEIRAMLSSLGLVKRRSDPASRKKEKPAQPKRWVSPEGFAILAGRSAAQNEALLKAAQPDDVWLHAKDVPGSHVLVSAQGREVPQATLLLAAKLACWFSGARGETARVDYTRRKFVRKVPGGAPGHVHYTGEKGLVVSMRAEEFRALDGKPDKAAGGP
ncbi:MAG TPA: NFACT RNA binding domain-containing protein [Candidatus Limnocylindria bacterium]|nr:NFACT RNA binding domain-containing protein [Candidatus Limnocylindria bacterium]